MENILLNYNIINIVKHIIYYFEPIEKASVLDTICKISTLCIAVVNVCLIFIIFCKNNSKDEKKRKLNLFKILIIDYNLKYLYDFFDKLKIETDKLKNNTLDVNGKRAINNEILQLNENVRQKFIDIFLAVDETLYSSILTSIDSLVDNFTENIFNSEIQLNDEDIFLDLITKQMTSTKTCIIKSLFDYSGS